MKTLTIGLSALLLITNPTYYLDQDGNEISQPTTPGTYYACDENDDCQLFTIEKTKVNLTITNNIIDQQQDYPELQIKVDQDNNYILLGQENYPDIEFTFTPTKYVEQEEKEQAIVEEKNYIEPKQSTGPENNIIEEQPKKTTSVNTSTKLNTTLYTTIALLSGYILIKKKH